ncbi:hypothetical protein T10_2601 [Trichinella papuae]|uniref:Uncharacterized protein n=1 Tax=Trichinella papuae TaxID=268474 RepID=A0A0V1N8K5_9BILA|nr:hypothetical protein T10_2601 [Trichinella papuae]
MNLRRNKWSLFGKPNEPDSEQILCLPVDPIELKPKLGGRQDVLVNPFSWKMLVARRPTSASFQTKGALLDEAEARVDKLQATQAVFCIDVLNG